MADSSCNNIRCCRGHRHPQEGDPNFVFVCRQCTAQITKENVGHAGGCGLCGPCAQMLKRCGHCGRLFGST